MLFYLPGLISLFYKSEDKIESLRLSLSRDLGNDYYLDVGCFILDLECDYFGCVNLFFTLVLTIRSKTSIWAFLTLDLLKFMSATGECN